MSLPAPSAFLLPDQEDKIIPLFLDISSKERYIFRVKKFLPDFSLPHLTPLLNLTLWVGHTEGFFEDSLRDVYVILFLGLLYDSSLNSPLCTLPYYSSKLCTASFLSICGQVTLTMQISDFFQNPSLNIYFRWQQAFCHSRTIQHVNAIRMSDLAV